MESSTTLSSSTCLSEGPKPWALTWGRISGGSSPRALSFCCQGNWAAAMFVEGHSYIPARGLRLIACLPAGVTPAALLFLTDPDRGYWSQGTLWGQERSLVLEYMNWEELGRQMASCAISILPVWNSVFITIKYVIFSSLFTSYLCHIFFHGQDKNFKKFERFELLLCPDKLVKHFFHWHFLLWFLLIISSPAFPCPFHVCAHGVWNLQCSPPSPWASFLYVLISNLYFILFWTVHWLNVPVH